MPDNLTAVLEAVKGLQESQKKTDALLEKVQADAQKAREAPPWGAPAVRSGESVMTSRPYSFMKALGVLAGKVDPEQCKVEGMLSDKLKKYHSGYTGFQSTQGRSFMLPLGGELITNDTGLANEVEDVVRAGTRPVSKEEVQEVRRQLANLGYTKALSWVDDSVGGSLVAPPQFGELIEVLRNNEVFMAAGARVVPMPPQGRLILPRQTSAMTAYSVGESTTITDSTPGTGDVVLSAKKLTLLAKIPNELFHFSAIPIEAFVREDMTKVISIKLDKILLESVGSSTEAKGIINYTNINSFTSGDPGTVTDGYRLQPSDPYNIVATTEEQNAEFNAFVMRPLLYSTLATRRADAVSAGDGKGPFVFNIIREISTDMNLERLKVGNLNGYPVFKTTQVSKTRAKGSSTNLTYVLGGNFRDYYVALGGALEFQVSTQGDTPFTTDQTWFRGVMYYDGAPRHEASFTLCDNIYQNT